VEVEEKPEGDEEEEEEELVGEALTPRTRDKRIKALVDSITYVCFNNVRRGLFERHKLIFSVILCLKILERDGIIESEELLHLTMGKI